MTGLVKAVKAQSVVKFLNVLGSRGIFLAALLSVFAAPAAAADAAPAGVGGPFEAVQPLKLARDAYERAIRDRPRGKLVLAVADGSSCLDE